MFCVQPVRQVRAGSGGDLRLMDGGRPAHLRGGVPGNVALAPSVRAGQEVSVLHQVR